MPGLLLTLTSEDITKEELATFLATLVPITDDMQLFSDYKDGSWDEFYTLKLKLVSSYGIYQVQQAYPGQSWSTVQRRVDFCERPGCYEKVAALSYEKVANATLHDRHGEEMHELYRHCVRHISRHSHKLAKSLEVVTLTDPKEEYWEEVALWRIGPKWYGQRLDLCHDGDYETGYYDYVAASPWLGPYATRDEALVAGKAYRF